MSLHRRFVAFLLSTLACGALAGALAVSVLSTSIAGWLSAHELLLGALSSLLVLLTLMAAWGLLRALAYDGPSWSRLGRAVHDMRVEQARLDRMQREFLAVASHELRTPAAALAAALETLDGAAKHDPTLRDDFIRRARREADRLQRMATDLLELAPMESSTALAKPAQCDVVQVCAEQAESFIAAAIQRGQTVDLTLPRQPTVAAIAHDALARVVGNVLDNGIKYGRPGGHVHLTVEVAESQVAILVDDDGKGIAPSEREQVFKPFYRAPVEASQEVRGTGLGLAIAQQLVTRSGGSIDVETNPMATGGTRIRIQLRLSVTVRHADG